MKKTETSSFGTGKRESHDSSAFYGRSMFDRDSNVSEQVAFYQRNLYRRIVDGAPNQLGLGLISSDSTEWMDKVYCKSAEDMKEIPDNSVALAFTSPPYNVGKEYDDDMSVQGYLGLIRRVGLEVYRVLKPGGRYVVNIANLGRKPYIPLHAWFYDVHLDVGFLPMGEIIWQKAKGSSGNCAWGSWMSAKAPRLRDIHEYLLVFTKEIFSRPDVGVSDIGRDEFLDSTISIWMIPPESAKRVGHPAPFPVELALKVAKLYSYVGDIILDPFVGSGTTCIAAVQSGRHYVGFDISSEYCKLAEKGIAEAKAHIVAGTLSERGRPSMAATKTECTELSVAFGILGVTDPGTISREELNRLFEGTLPLAKYALFQKEYADPITGNLYQQMVGVGRYLRTRYRSFNKISTLKWTGGQKQASSTSAAVDLLVANTPISLKADSEVLGNRSPHNLFVSLPENGAQAQSAEHWYLKLAPEEYESMYSFLRTTAAGLESLPESVVGFEEVATKHDRKALEGTIQQLSPEHRAEFQDRYLAMCRAVATKSADLFNTKITQALQTNIRASVLEEVARQLFRMDAVDYIIGGLEHGKEFAVLIPSLTSWKGAWRITTVRAEADLKREQSVVYIFVTYSPKRGKLLKTVKFEVQIRWSHKKFASAPEAKLYKKFSWKDVDFVALI